MTQDGNIENKVDIGLNLQSANLMTTLLLRVLENRFLQFPLEDVFDLNCWLATIPAPVLDQFGMPITGYNASASIRELELDASDLSLTLDCMECGPLVEKVSSLLADSTTNADEASATQAAIELVENILKGNWIQTIIDRRLAYAPKNCRHRAEYQPNSTPDKYLPPPLDKGNNDSTSMLVAVLVTILSLLIVAATITMLIRLIVSYRHRKWLKSLSDEQLQRAYLHQEYVSVMDAQLNEGTLSLFRSTCIPVFIQWLVPFILVGNIGLFLSGHLSPGATVKAFIQFGGEEIRIEELYSVSVAESAIELWNSGARALAVRSVF
jgi:hypothetical protein